MSMGCGLKTLHIYLQLAKDVHLACHALLRQAPEALDGLYEPQRPGILPRLYLHLRQGHLPCCATHSSLAKESGSAKSLYIRARTLFEL